jgi:hypothetical protein
MNPATLGHVNSGTPIDTAPSPPSLVARNVNAITITAQPTAATMAETIPTIVHFRMRTRRILASVKLCST